MKPLIRVSATDAAALRPALADALAGGPAVWPVPDGEPATAEAAVAREVEDDIALVVETSGSTDAPKRVLLAADALEASADATHDALGSTGQWLLALPGHYIAGAQVLVRGILAGTETVVLSPGSFDPAAFAAASARLDARVPRYTSLVPAQLARLLDAAERDAFVGAAARSFDAILVGGQALAPALAARAADAGLAIVRTYGSSETAGGCVYDGRPLDGVAVRIVDPSPETGRGEVQLAGPMLASGYLDDPARTAAAFTTDARGRRWYRTGDLGDLSPDGVLRITGRADDVIISGGVKVSLGEVERAVRAVAGFAEAVVLPVADAEWGERAVVVVERTDAAASVIRDDLAAATDGAGLPPAGRPVRLVVIERMPHLASGKPDRRALAALLANEGRPAERGAGS
ncbi:AMP-binding protein [Agromyces salentinus]|uniref:O-succinylbenzoate--CoA ligase n=1 Tax=Agromyces salentinus TaxID=269421 RepID=A0ABN2MVB7_9MICO|nr:AMP-binding protein [Agromyces salentinus]